MTRTVTEIEHQILVFVGLDLDRQLIVRSLLTELYETGYRDGESGMAAEVINFLDP